MTVLASLASGSRAGTPTKGGATLAAVPGSAAAIITIDAGGAVSSWNRAAERLFGYSASEIVGRPIAVLVPEERLVSGELFRLGELVEAHGSVRELTTTRLTKDGHAVAVSISYGELTDASGTFAGYSCAMRPLGGGDVADRFHESEKLAALRAISAGFAQEIGNPLAGVVGVLQLVARRTREPETRARLLSAHADAARVAQVIRELGDFTRRDGAARIVDVNEVLRAALTLARYAHQHAHVTVVLEADPRVRPLVGSRNHLLQALLHLAINAYEAIGEHEGRLRVTSHAEGAAILVVFEDTGIGIPAPAIAHLFDPFFTTKGSTGLGLFVCRRIVADELGGTVAVETEPGCGARFIVRLPIGDANTAARPRRRLGQRSPAA